MKSHETSRRRVLTSLGAGGALALSGCVGGDDGDDGSDGDGDGNGDGGTTQDTYDGLQIGVLGAYTGENGPEFGHQGITGFLSGLAYKDDSDPYTNEALDVSEGSMTPVDAIHEEVIEVSVDDMDFQLHIRDTQDDPREASRMASELVGDADVDMLFGVSNSDGLLRVVNNVVEVNQVPLFSGGGASVARATADDDTCSNLLYRATETSAMRARAGAEYIIDQEFDRVAIMVADFSFGRSVRDNYKQVLENAGIDVVQVVTEAQNHQDWQGHIAEAQELDVEVIVYGFTAQTGIPFFRDFTTNEAGEPDIPNIRIIGDAPSRLGTNEMGVSIEQRIAELEGNFAGLTLEQALTLVKFGPFTTGYMWNQYDNPINDRFIEDQRNAYGVNPDLFSGSSFATSSAIVQALNEEGEISTDAVIEGAYGMEVQDTPKGSGEYVFQEYNNQARSPLTVAPLEVNDDPFWPAPIRVSGGEDVFRVDKDRVTLPASEVECDLQ